MTDFIINCIHCNSVKDVSLVSMSAGRIQFTCAECGHVQTTLTLQQGITEYIEELTKVEKGLLDTARVNKGKISNDDFYTLLEAQDLLPRLKKLIPT